MKRKFDLRNQYGMALWVKIVLGILAVGLLVSIAAGIFLFSFFKDAVDPKKTEEVANKIVTMASPLPPPFEYGRMNVSVQGYSIALITDTGSKALYILMQFPRKDASMGAQRMIDQVARGEAALPDARGGGLQADGKSGTTAAKNSMKVEEKGVLDVGGSKMYYVKGKAASAKRTSSATPGDANTSDTSPPAMDTFFGAADSRDPKSTTFIMVQQEDTTKRLTMDEIKAFTSAIKSI